MGWIASLLAAQGLPDRWARRIAIGFVIALVIIALWIGKIAWERSVIARHDGAVALDQARDDRAADAGAATARRSDDARIAHEKSALEKVTAHAPDDAGAARRAYYECVRLQQQARRDGRVPPAC